MDLDCETWLVPIEDVRCDFLCSSDRISSIAIHGFYLPKNPASCIYGTLSNSMIQLIQDPTSVVLPDHQIRRRSCLVSFILRSRKVLVPFNWSFTFQMTAFHVFIAIFGPRKWRFSRWFFCFILFRRHFDVTSQGVFVVTFRVGLNQPSTEQENLSGSWSSNVVNQI